MRALNVMTLGTILLGGLGLSSTAVHAEEGLIVDINEISCREMLKMDGDEQELTMVFVHGYVSGKSAMTQVDGPALRAASEEIADACIDGPEKSLLSVVEMVRGG